MSDQDDISKRRCTLFPGNPTYEEMAQTVATRRASDPEFDAQCQQDIDDFFKPSPLLELLRRKQDS